MSETKTESEETDEHGKYRWMRGDQIDTDFPPEISAALKENLKKDDTCFKPHPQLPDCEAAAMYKVLVSMEEDWSNKQKNERKRKLTVDTSAGGEAAMALASASSTQATPGVRLKMLKTPEEIAAVEAEKKRKKVEAATKREARKHAEQAEANKPENRAKHWAQQLADDCRTLKMKMKEVTDAVHIPAESKEEHKEIFKKVLTKIEGHRNTIEDLRAPAPPTPLPRRRGRSGDVEEARSLPPPRRT